MEPTEAPLGCDGGGTCYNARAYPRCCPGQCRGGQEVHAVFPGRVVETSYYDAGLGRFTQRDPVSWGTGSRYSYADDWPTVSVDPSGRLPIIIIVAPGVGFAAGWSIGCLLAARDEAQRIIDECYALAKRSHHADWRCDLLGHCFGGCRAVRCTRIRCLARFVVHNQMDLENNEPTHVYWNHVGYGLGWQSGDCEDLCAAAWSKYWGPIQLVH